MRPGPKPLAGSTHKSPLETTTLAADEAGRLEALREYGILDTAPDAAFDDLVSLAALICGAPMSLITLVDERRQWFKSAIGMDGLGETSRNISICSHAIAGRSPFVVSDTTVDARFRNYSTVTGAPHIRFYAGVPLVTESGHALGTICVMDRVPRQLTSQQLAALEVLSRQVMAQLELRRSTQATRASEERLHLALDAAQMGIYDWDMVRNRIDCSPWQEVLWGFTPGDFDGTLASLTARVHPDDFGALRKEGARCIAERAAFACEFRVIWPDGSAHWVGARGDFMYTAAGDAVRMRGTVVEITDRMEAEERLWLSHERFQLVTRATNDAVWDWDLQTNALWWNEGYASLFGYPPAQTDSSIKSWIEHIHPDDHERVIESINRAVRGGDSTWSDEYRYLRHDGRVADIFDRGYIIRDANEVPVRMIGAMQDITARKNAETAAERLALRLTLATDAASIGVWDWDLDTDEWYASPTYFTMLGYAPEDHSGDRDFWLNRLHPDDRPMVKEKIRAVIAGQLVSYHYQARMLHANGWYRWIEVTGRVLSHDAEGKPTRLIGIRLDITDQKRAAEDRVHFLERITDAFIALDRDWRYTFVNARAAELMGRSTEELIGESIWTVFPASLDDPFRRAFEQAMQRQEPVSLEEFYAPFGLWLELRVYPSADGMSVYFHDISIRKQSERQVMQLNRVYAVLSAINQAIVRIKDRATMLSSACEIAVEIGRFRMAWIGLRNPAGGDTLDIAAHAGVPEEVIEQLRERLKSRGQAIDVAYSMAALETGHRAVCNDVVAETDWPGEIPPPTTEYQSMVSLPLRSAGEVIGTLNLYAHTRDHFDAQELTLLDELATDVGSALQVHAQEMERARFEQALHDSEDRFRQLAENIQEVFWITDVSTGRMLYVSPAYETIWGRSCQELYDSQHAWEDSLHPEDRARVIEATHTKQTRGDYAETYRVVRPDGAVRWIRDRAFPVRDPDGTVVRMVGTAEDITAARLLEEQLRQSQKMEAVGQLAGGVAHDFNNILAAIMMQADLARTLADSPAETRELLDDIKSATQRAANLTRQLLAFSRRQVMLPRDVDLNEVVTDFAKMLQRILGGDVELQLNLHSAALTTHADPGMIDQVLMNLVINSRDAMPHGGTLFVATAEVTLSEMEATTIPDARAGRYACLRVGDTGEGIATEHLTRIFEPFFTTKGPGKGTGLGLATVFGIVRQHDGFIRVTSERGGGTRFDVHFPASLPAIAPDAVSSAPVKPRGGPETILVVEDEPSVRTLTRIVLQRAGYNVLVAEDGRAALEVWAEHGERIDLLLTDMVMPGGMSGRELAAELLAVRPRLAVIFTSGYSADIAGRELSLEQGRNFVQKPSGPQVLLETVRRCLDSQSGPSSHAADH